MLETLLDPDPKEDDQFTPRHPADEELPQAEDKAQEVRVHEGKAQDPREEDDQRHHEEMHSV